MGWTLGVSSLFSIFLHALSSSHPRQEPFHRLQNPDLRSPCYYGHFLSWRNAHTFSLKENYGGQPINTSNNGHILKIHYNFISFIRPLKPVMFILSLRSGCVLQNGARFSKLPVITGLFCFPFQMGVSRLLKVIQCFQLKKQSGLH